ncbi:MAG: phytanoyl-CoA dioxygenase family protein [Pirellulaceae bacterium]
MNTNNQFKIVPDNDELASLDRELRFFPSTTREPRRLTTDEVERFNREGYLTGLPVFTDAEIVEHRAYFDDLLARTLAEGKDSYSISSAHLRHRRVWQILTEPRIVDYVADLLGPNVVGWGSHYFCKMPRDGKAVSWHQDASYWPLTPSKTVTVWLAIDDADRENGCMRVIPGTHLHGHLEYRESDTVENNVLNQTIDQIERFGEAADIVLRSGQISIHSDLLLHGSEANNSDRRRCGLTLRYCPADVAAHLGWNAKGVVVAGEADRSQWPGAAEPTTE